MGLVAVLGTGLMGGPMAANLSRAGHEVRVWNRTRAKAEALVSEGCVVADAPEAAVAGAEVVITMLSDGAASCAMVEEYGAGLGERAVWVDMSSTKPSEARAQAEVLGGSRHLDAPVSGGTRGAEAGTLAIMAGGEAGTFARAAPVLQAMGRPTHVGPSGAGQLAKLANQAIVAITMGAVAEAMLFLERGGGDPAAVRAALKGGFADSVILQEHGERMTERNFVPGGPAKFQIKDLGNVLEVAGEVGIALPFVTEMRARFGRLCEEMGAGDRDVAAIYLELLDRNGLTP